MIKGTKRLLLACSALTIGLGGTIAFSHSRLCEGFAPKNDLSIPVGKSLGGLDESQWNLVLDGMERVYAPIFASKGGVLKLKRLWTSSDVNAYADRSWLSGAWEVRIYGGLARHPATDMDVLVVVTCHEMGHQVGGAPKVSGFMDRWASTEGQSDYYATLKCFRTLAAANALPPEDTTQVIPEFVSATCAAEHLAPADQKLCERAALAGFKTAALLASLSRRPSVALETPDRAIVSRTNTGYPSEQCRLDTYYNGALCNVAHAEDVSDTNAAVGSCMVSSERAIGARPSCWYKN